MTESEQKQTEVINQDDFVYVVTASNENSFSSKHIPVAVFEREKDATEFVNEKRGKFNFAYGYRLKLQ